jgi:hypothetical protein
MQIIGNIYEHDGVEFTFNHEMVDDLLHYGLDCRVFIAHAINQMQAAAGLDAGHFNVALQMLREEPPTADTYSVTFRVRRR